jgi:hypothetical protein
VGVCPGRARADHPGCAGRTYSQLVLMRHLPDCLALSCHRMYEIPTTLPGPSRLEIDMWDYDRLSANDFIGKTVIDLEDRWFEQAWQDFGWVQDATCNMCGGM